MKLAILLALAGAWAGPPARPPSKGLPYSCKWIEAPSAPVTPCAPRPEVSAVFAAAELYPAANHVAPTDEHWKQIDEAVTKMNDVNVESLGNEERIVAQNAVLQIAMLASVYKHASPKAGPLIAKLALPAEKLGAGEPDLAGWLGDADAWTERKVSAPIYFHENIYRLTRHARAVLAKGRRVLFTQLVAIDTAWKPHVTSLVGEIELRQTIHPAAAACIVVLDPEALRCGVPGGLRKKEEKSFAHLGGYETVNDGFTNCTSCHRAKGVLAFDVTDVPKKKGAAFVSGRRTTFLNELEKYLAALKR